MVSVEGFFTFARDEEGSALDRDQAPFDGLPYQCE